MPAVVARREAHDRGGDAVERRARHQADVDARARAIAHAGITGGGGAVEHAADHAAAALRALARPRRATTPRSA